MKRTVLCLALAACGSTPPPAAPPPIVSSFSPTSGLWGTEVTIGGENFGPQPATSSVGFTSSVGNNGFVIDNWNVTQITGRIAFPGTGPMTVTTEGGTADVGTFATTEPWVPTTPLDVAELSSELVLSTGDVASISREYSLSNIAALAVYSGSAAGAYQLADVDPTDTSAAVPAQLVEADDHTPEVIATQTDGTLVAFTIAAGAVVNTPTGLTGAVVAAGRDGSGAYAWIDVAAGVERVRPAATWTVDRGPFATTAAPLAGAIAADGTLWIAVGDPDGANMAFPSVQTLAPAASAFAAVEHAAAASVATPISQVQLVLASDGAHAALIASSGATPTALTPRLRTAAATWSDAPAVTGLVQYGFFGTTLGAISNDSTSKTITLLQDASMAGSGEVIPVWPMQCEGFAFDGSNAPYPLITNSNVTYALAPPPAGP